MARLVKTVLGKVSGAIGDLVFRQRGDLNYIATRPASFMPGTDEASVNRRSKFGMAAKLASSINLIGELFQLWEEVNSARSAFQNALSANYPYVPSDGTGGDFKISPINGFGVGNPLITISPSEVQTEIDPLGSNIGIDTAVEKTVKLVSVLLLSNPLDPYAPAYQFIDLSSDDVVLQTTSPLVFSIPLMNQDAEACKLYQNKDAYFAVVTLDADGNVIHYSSTFRKV